MSTRYLVLYAPKKWCQKLHSKESYIPALRTRTYLSTPEAPLTNLRLWDCECGSTSSVSSHSARSACLVWTRINSYWISDNESKPCSVIRTSLGNSFNGPGSIAAGRRWQIWNEADEYERTDPVSSPLWMLTEAPFFSFCYSSASLTQTWSCLAFRRCATVV